MVGGAVIHFRGFPMNYVLCFNKMESLGMWIPTSQREKLCPERGEHSHLCILQLPSLPTFCIVIGSCLFSWHPSMSNSQRANSVFALLFLSSLGFKGHPAPRAGGPLCPIYLLLFCSFESRSSVGPWIATRGVTMSLKCLFFFFF